VTTIGECLKAYGLSESYLSMRTRDGYEQWASWDSESVCGQACIDLMDKTFNLLVAIDPLARPALWEALITAMNIICNG
jgi:hypothetical protein